jgi:hypothetical protein
MDEPHFSYPSGKNEKTIVDMEDSPVGAAVGPALGADGAFVGATGSATDGTAIGDNDSAADGTPGATDCTADGTDTPMPSSEEAPKLKLGWKGALDKLARQGDLGTKSKWKVLVKDVKSKIADIDNYDAGIRKHTFGASFGSTKRDGLVEPTPAPCPVHSYETNKSTLKSNTGSFGKAERTITKPLPPRESPKPRTTTEEEGVPSLTLGWKGMLGKLQLAGELGTKSKWQALVRDAKAATADLDNYDAGLRKHTFGASFGNTKREGLYKDPECGVHSYETNSSTFKSNTGSFGKGNDKAPPT